MIRSQRKLATPRIPSYIINVIRKEVTAPQRYEIFLKRNGIRVIFAVPAILPIGRLVGKDS